MIKHKAKKLTYQLRKFQLKHRATLNKVPLIRRLGVISKPSIRLSQDQILTQVSRQFPIKKSYLVIFELVVDRPRLDIHAIDDRFNMGFDIKVHMSNAQTKVFHGEVDLSMGVAFENINGTVYLTDPRLISLVVNGLPEALNTTVGNILNEALLNKLERFPVYQLESSSRREKTLKKVLKDIQLGEGEIILSLGLSQ